MGQHQSGGACQARCTAHGRDVHDVVTEPAAMGFSSLGRRTASRQRAPAHGGGGADPLCLGRDLVEHP
eukprot:7550907-Lingulodinium_polyedra.AAC.1